jgi:hypothetical protein
MGRLAVVVTATLVTSVANGVSADSAKHATDGGSFEATTTLRADDAADGSAAETADDGPLLSSWSRGAGSDGDGGDDGEDDVFHNKSIIVTRQ